MNRHLQTLIGGACFAACVIASAEAPKALRQVPPDFPAAAVRQGVGDGVLNASLAVDASGAVTDVRIVDASPPKARIFNEATVDALKQWQFEGTGAPQTVKLKLVFREE